MKKKGVFIGGSREGGRKGSEREEEKAKGKGGGVEKERQTNERSLAEEFKVKSDQINKNSSLIMKKEEVEGLGVGSKFKKDDRGNKKVLDEIRGEGRTLKERQGGRRGKQGKDENQQNLLVAGIL